MSKSVTSGPLPYDPSFNSNVEQAPTPQAQETPSRKGGPLQYDPSFNQNVKKNIGQGASDFGGTESPSPQTAQNWQDQNLKSKDVAQLGTTQFGQQLGLDMIPKSQRQAYADAHNVGTLEDVASKAKDISDAWGPILKRSAGVGTTLDQQSGKDSPERQIDNMVNGMKGGDPDSIYAFKNKVLASIDKDIENSKTKKDITYTRWGVLETPTPETKQKIDVLNKQKEYVTAALDEYASMSLVNTATKMPGGIHEPLNLMWIGRNVRRLGEGVSEFKAQQNIPHDSDAATDRNFTDEQAGYDAAITMLAKQAGADHKNAVQSRNPDQAAAAELRKSEVNQLIQKRNSLPQDKYFPVDVYNTAKIIGDRFADESTYNKWFNPQWMEATVENLKKDNPEFYQAHEKAIKFIMNHPSEMPLPGFMGGLQRSIQPIEWIERKVTGRSAAEQDMLDNYNALQQGTSYSGKTPIKVAVDANGKDFLEKPNENYDTWNFNSLVGGAGEFSGNVAIYGLLTEGAGEAVGLGIRGTSALAQATKVAKGFEIGAKAKQFAGVLGSTYLMNYDNNMKVANTLIKDDSGHGDLKKGLVANLMTIGQATAMDILPANQILRANFLKGMADDAVEVLSKAGADGITKDVTQSFLDKVKDRAVNVGKEAAKLGIQTAKVNVEMVITNHINDAVSSMFDETGATKKNNLLQQDINTLRDVTLGSLFMGIPRMAKAAFPLNYRDALYDAALHADENVERIRNEMSQGTMDPEKGNGIIKLIKTAQQHLPEVLNAKTGNEAKPEDGTGMRTSTRQKATMLMEKVRASILSDAAQSSTDPEIPKAQAAAETSYQAAKEEVPYIPTQPTSNETSNTQVPQGQEGKNAEVKSPQAEGAEAAKEAVPLKPEDQITVKEMLDKSGTYKGERGQFYQDGQTVIFKPEGKNREYELGNIDEVGGHSIKDYGIEAEQSVVDVNDKGNPVVRGKEYVNNYSDPLQAIVRDKDGNVTSVNLETTEGQKRNFRGDVAEDLAYQIHLKEIDKRNETREAEDFINNDEAARKALEATRSGETAEGGGAEDTGEVQRTKIERQQRSPIKTEEHGTQTGVKKEDSQNQEGRQGNEIPLVQKEDGDGRRPTGESQERGRLLSEEGPAEAGKEEVGPSHAAAEMKENHQEAIRNIDRKEDGITDKDLQDPSKVRESVLKNIAAKELGKEKLTPAEQTVADARRADIDEIKVEDKARRFDKRMTDEDRKRRNELKRKVDLIDKFGHEDIVKHLIKKGIIKADCA